MSGLLLLLPPSIGGDVTQEELAERIAVAAAGPAATLADCSLVWMALAITVFDEPLEEVLVFSAGVADAGSISTSWSASSAARTVVAGFVSTLPVAPASTKISGADPCPPLEAPFTATTLASSGV